MSCEQRFDDILREIRRGTDAYPPMVRRDFVARRRDIALYRRGCPNLGDRILARSLAYYYTRQKEAHRLLLVELRRTLHSRKTPPWLRLRQYSLLANLTLNDPNTTRSDNDRYRHEALRLARERGRRDEEAVILNNWLFAAIDRRDVSVARKLASRVRPLLRSLRPTLRSSPQLQETLARFKTHEAKLALLASRNTSARTALRAQKSAETLYRSALSLESSDTNRRVNVLVEWAFGLIEYVDRPDLAKAEELLERAMRSIDARVTNLTRAYFYEVRGRLRLCAGDELRNVDLDLARDAWRNARSDLQNSIRLYERGGRPRSIELQRLEKEAKVHLERFSKVPAEIRESLPAFLTDHPDPARMAFVMMNYRGSKRHRAIFKAIQSALAGEGIKAVRAKDAEYHDNIYENVRTYMYGCGMGVAVFDRIEKEHHNPNVALEVGYMLALRKPVCILKEKSVSALQSDLAGHLYREFDLDNLARSVRDALAGWIATKRPSPTPRQQAPRGRAGDALAVVRPARQRTVQE